MKDDQVAALAHAIRSISHGGGNGPTGLETLVMVLVGQDSLRQKSIGQRIDNLTDEVNRLANAAERIAAELEYRNRG